jgi:hypothetical protein
LDKREVKRRNFYFENFFMIMQVALLNKKNKKKKIKIFYLKNLEK